MLPNTIFLAPKLHLGVLELISTQKAWLDKIPSYAPKYNLGASENLEDFAKAISVIDGIKYNSIINTINLEIMYHNSDYEQESFPGSQIAFGSTWAHNRTKSLIRQKQPIFSQGQVTTYN